MSTARTWAAHLAGACLAGCPWCWTSRALAAIGDGQADRIAAAARQLTGNDGGVYERQILNALWRVERRLEMLMSQQDEINADVAELNSADDEILAEIAKLQAANPALDLTALKAAADRTAAIPPAAPPVTGG